MLAHAEEVGPETRPLKVLRNSHSPRPVLLRLSQPLTLGYTVVQPKETLYARAY